MHVCLKTSSAGLLWFQGFSDSDLIISVAIPSPYPSFGPETDRQTDRETYRQTERQAGRQTDRQLFQKVQQNVQVYEVGFLNNSKTS